MTKKFLSKRELLPTPIMYIPIFFYGIYLGIKHRNITFFTNVNSFVQDNSLESDKYSLINKIEDSFNPRTLLIDYQKPLSVQIKSYLFEYPCIVKPNYGCRGLGVKKIYSIDMLKEYHNNIKKDYLLQEFISDPLELGIFFIKQPHQKHGKIVGVVYKEFPFVTGDGVSTLQELIASGERTRLFLKNYYERNKIRRNDIIPNGEIISITDLGNHAQGSKCYDITNIITQKTIEVFNRISSNIGGVCFGRYDIKCSSFESFSSGKDIKIIELNGVIAEPLHLYDHKYSPRKAYKIRFGYIHEMMQISIEHKKLGYVPLGFIDSLKLLYKQWNQIR